MDYQAVTFRLPVEVYENLRREAFVTKRSMNELVAESIVARYAGKRKVVHHIDGSGNPNAANLALMDADGNQPKDTR